VLLLADEPLAPDGGGSISKWLRRRKLGAGTTGVVYVATPAPDQEAAANDDDGGRTQAMEIAAKLVTPRGNAAQAALREEVRLMRRLHHQHVRRPCRALEAAAYATAHPPTVCVG
jgi:hypothetical protein